MPQIQPEWTSDGKGLEFTLATVMPPVPSNIAFGPFNFERQPVQMVRCITADLLGDKYGIHVDSGGCIAQHRTGCWLLLHEWMQKWNHCTCYPV